MTRRLIDGCDAILADLDGVVYAGPGAISEAPESLERAKSEGDGDEGGSEREPETAE